jgi:hypothetical protein
MSEGAVPVKDLNDNGEDKTAHVKPSDRPVPFPPECPEYEEEDPEKVDEDREVCENSVKHFLCYSSLYGTTR